jgi:hypothetical protein
VARSTWWRAEGARAAIGALASAAAAAVAVAAVAAVAVSPLPTRRRADTVAAVAAVAAAAGRSAAITIAIAIIATVCVVGSTRIMTICFVPSRTTHVIRTDVLLHVGLRFRVTKETRTGVEYCSAMCMSCYIQHNPTAHCSSRRSD